jgi:NAD(P)-dependent dehydrogenase (short-subunit alcohol dehydrogenase family)
MAATDKPSVLVTGSSAGFGNLIVRTVALAGHRVFATMRDVDGNNAESTAALGALAAERGLALDVFEMDVAVDDSVSRAVHSILTAGNEIDVVVNNAGISARGPLEAYTSEQLQRIFNVNCFGQVRVSRAVLPHMRARGSGLLIQVSSTLGRVLPHSGGLYPATKWAVEGLAESLAYEVKPFGIDVVILEPGAFPTTSTARSMRAADEQVAEEYARAREKASPRPASQPPTDYHDPDLQIVADEVQRLIDLEPGTRPLRAVVGPIFTEGVPEYNAFYEETRDRLREALRRPDQAISWGPRAR